MAKAKRRILPFFIPHQGCPNQCVFCNQHRITGRSATIDFAGIWQDIEQLRPEDSMEIAFYGGSFTGLPWEVQCKLLAPAYKQKETGAVSHIRISTRPDYIDAERLRQLQQYGVDTIEIGVQSLNDEVLAKAGRGHTYADICRAVDLIKAYGFQLIIQLLPGLPGDSYEQAVSGAQQTAAWQPEGVRIYPAVVLADTPLYDMYQAGSYQPLSVTEAVAWCRDMAAFFILKNIQIIRIGLQPTEDISEGGAVMAGAFHPAFGQLVQSALALEQCRMLLAAGGVQNKTGCFLVPERLLSTYIGQKKINLMQLRHTYGQGIKILPGDNLCGHEIRFQQDNGCSVGLCWQDFLTAYTKKIAMKIAGH